MVENQWNYPEKHPGPTPSDLAQTLSSWQACVSVAWDGSPHIFSVFHGLLSGRSSQRTLSQTSSPLKDWNLHRHSLKINWVQENWALVRVKKLLHCLKTYLVRVDRPPNPQLWEQSLHLLKSPHSGHSSLLEYSSKSHSIHLVVEISTQSLSSWVVLSDSQSGRQL